MQRHGNHMAILCLGTLMVLVVTQSMGCSASLAQPDEKAADFTLKSLEETKINLKEVLANKAVVLWFTNLCHGCQKNMPALERLYQKHYQSIEILAVSQLGEETRALKDAIEQTKVTFPFLLDPSGEVSRLYSGEYVKGSCPINNMFFIDRQGEIKSKTRYPGLREAELKRQIENLIGKPQGR